MGARFENFALGRALHSVLKFVKSENVHPEFADQNVFTADLLGGGFAGRELQVGGDFSPGVDIAGINSYAIPLIHPVASTGVAGVTIQNNDGFDRRVIAASMSINFAAAPTANSAGIEVGYYLKPDPDGSTIIPVLWAKPFPMDGTSIQFDFPLTGFVLPGGVFHAGGDPANIGESGPMGIASTWDKLVPAGWAFYGYVAYWSPSALANFPATTKLLPSIGAIKKAVGTQVPR